VGNQFREVGKLGCMKCFSGDQANFVSDTVINRQVSGNQCKSQQIFIELIVHAASATTCAISEHAVAYQINVSL